MMTESQYQTLAAALRAETDAGVVNYLANRMDVQLAEWCNADSAVVAWQPAMTNRLLFEAGDVTKFDGLSAGKRDSWKLLLEFAPIDFSRNKMRKAVTDIWGNTDSVAVLQACTRKATNAENYLGGNSATENTVTALKLKWTGVLSHSEISDVLNRY
jgi:hypothetical protein